jgi:HAD superfamily hydrolase (TIGR01450 family)
MTSKAAFSAGSWMIDLDGVLWLAERPIPGSAEAVERLRSAGVPVVFATNNADPTRSELLSKLEAAGVEAEEGHVVTSADAAATMLSPGERAVACGGEGLVEALEERGVTIVPEGPADAVVVGMTRAFDYAMLTTAALAVRGGARLIGTNEDPTHPTPRGLYPGSGALLAAVATAAQTQPVVAGKPHPPMASLLRERFPDLAVVVGDRPATDGLLARRLGVSYALVFSGVTASSHGELEVQPDIEASDLAALVDDVLSNRSAAQHGT